MPRFMTKQAAMAAFRETHLPAIRAAYEADGVPDYIARREEWNNYTDALLSDGLITDWQCENWSHPTFCLRPSERPNFVAREALKVETRDALMAWRATKEVTHE